MGKRVKNERKTSQCCWMTVVKKGNLIEGRHNTLYLEPPLRLPKYVTQVYAMQEQSAVPGSVCCTPGT